MAWTYSGDPTTSPMDEVRFLVGDTNENDPQLQDKEVQYELLKNANVYGAAASCARDLYAKFSRLCDKSVGDLHLSYSQKRDGYKELITTLEKKAGITTAVPFAGGQSVSGKQSNASNTDNVQPTFYRNQFDFPGQ